MKQKIVQVTEHYDGDVTTGNLFYYDRLNGQLKSWIDNALSSANHNFMIDLGSVAYNYRFGNIGNSPSAPTQSLVNVGDDLSNCEYIGSVTISHI